MVPKKRRGFGLFSDDFGDFDDIFEKMREDMEKMMADSFRSFDESDLEKLSRDPNTRVYGFSMRVGPDGKPILREFGNVKPALKGSIEPGEREPLVDVIPKDDVVTVIAELPGVDKKEIDLTATEDTLTIDVKNPERHYHKVVKLPVKVKSETAKARYNNGILEVDLERLEKGKKEKKGKNISID